MKWGGGEDIKGNGGCYLRAQVLREVLKISSPLALLSREVPRFHGGSLWHCTPGAFADPKTEGRTPPLGPVSLIFMYIFREKIGQIISFHAHLWSPPSSPGNHGATTGTLLNHREY